MWARVPPGHEPDDVSACQDTAAAFSMGCSPGTYMFARHGSGRYREAVHDMHVTGTPTKERTLTSDSRVHRDWHASISGEGEGGAQWAPGDLYVFIEVPEHPFFRREANNLACEIPLNFTTLALGGHIDVPTLDGTDSFKIPEGTQSGAVFRLRGKGMPDVSGRGRGDLYFTAQAVTPKKLNKEQRRRSSSSRTLPRKSRAARARAEEDEKNSMREGQRYFGKPRPRRSRAGCDRTCRACCRARRVSATASGADDTSRLPHLPIIDLATQPACVGCGVRHHLTSNHNVEARNGPHATGAAESDRVGRTRCPPWDGSDGD